jgi:hypothetical protein
MTDQISGLLNGIEPELAQKLSRREIVTAQAVRLGAYATVPLLLAGCATTMASTSSNLPGQVVDVLNFALTLEYLEDDFYRTGLAQPGLIPAGWQNTFRKISQHEAAHVALLRSVLGGSAVAKPAFDFTAGGAFGDVFSNFNTFAAVAQAFEDTGVRAYKGQAGNLMGAPDILTTALQIHSVEARHASQVRRIRGQEGWITGSSRGNLPGATQAVYDGEGVGTQAGVNITNFVSAEAATAAFDEPLSKEQVLAIAGLFLA